MASTPIIDNGTMTENTLQKVIMIFAFAVSFVTAAVVVTFCYLVIKDGNNPLVAQAFTDLAGLAQNAFYSIAAVIVGKPIASGLLQFFQGKSIQASTQNVPLTASSIPVTQNASSQSAQGLYTTAT